MNMCTKYIRDQTARSVQSDPDLDCPQKLLVSSPLRKELILNTTAHRGTQVCGFETCQTKNVGHDMLLIATFCRVFISQCLKYHFVPYL